MSRRELGATVSVMWVIFLIVLLLGAGAYIYFVQAEIAKAQSDTRNADVAADKMEKAMVGERQKHLDLSVLVGFRDEAAGEVFSSTAAIESKIEQLKGRFTNDIGSGDATLEDLADRLVGIASKFDQAAQDADSSFQSEKGKRQQSETDRDSIQTSMTDQIATLNTDLQDERDRGSAQKNQDDDQIATLQDQVNEVSAQARERAAEAAQKIAEANQRVNQKDGRIAQLNEKVKLIGVDEDPWAKDGEVVSVGDETGLVYVNIGSNDLLRTGVKFDVFYHGKGGKLMPKGSIEIREVDSDSAVGGIVEELDELNPIASGDIIANPHFSTSRSKVFHLLGTFPIYGKTFLENRLKALGAEVEPDVNSRVDFIVLGQRSPEEDAPELAELPGYKLANELGIQMLPVRSIDRFLKP